MKIIPIVVPVRELVKGYRNSDEEGVVGYDGKLNIRPKYQREFIYKPAQQVAVIKTIRNRFPLNTMYWAHNVDDTFEIIDGQQRTLSIAEYVAGNFAIDFQYFHNLEESAKEHILSYELMVYLCQGDSAEKLEWFRTINIAGEKLTDQELRNATYAGPWLSDAKGNFSKTNCPAHNIAKDYVSGSAIRQDFLETAIDWISDGNIEMYMATHQHDQNANPLWLHFKRVIDWAKATFTTYRSEMKGVEWGRLYREHGEKQLDTRLVEEEISRLMMDDDVTRKKGVYDYVLSRNEKHLSIRTFTPNQRREAFERQGGVCPSCGKRFELNDMEADHTRPWAKGGRTTTDNCRMLCVGCNRIKSDV